MRAARDFGYPPLALWGRRNRYSRHALVLVEALRMFEDSLCKGCGHSGFLTFDHHENTGHFRVDTIVCIGCEGLEARAKSMKADDQWPGEKSYAVNTMDDEPEAT